MRRIARAVQGKKEKDTWAVVEDQITEIRKTELLVIMSATATCLGHSGKNKQHWASLVAQHAMPIPRVIRVLFVAILNQRQRRRQVK